MYNGGAWYDTYALYTWHNRGTKLLLLLYILTASE